MGLLEEADLATQPLDTPDEPRQNKLLVAIFAKLRREVETE